MTSQPFEALIALLEQENAIYCELACLLDEEREAMLAMAVERLGEIVSRKETLLLRIKALDESRKVLARRLGEMFGMDPDAVTVSGLCAAAPADLARRLGQAGQKLRQSVEVCQSTNDFNARAAHRGLDLVSGAIRHLFEQANPEGKVYNPRRVAPGRRTSASASFISRQV